MLSDSDKKAILRTMEQLVACMAASEKNWPALAEFYCEDVMVMPPNAPAVRGKKQLVEFFEAFPPMPEFISKSQEIDGAGDLAWSRDEYAATIAPPGVPPIQDKGKSMSIWRKQADGAWKILRDIWNSDLPQPGA